MINFNRLPLKQKLVTIIMTLCILVQVACSSLFLADKIISFRQETLSTISTLAEVAAINSTAAVSFNDHVTAGEILSAMNVVPNIRIATIYNKNGEVFASYEKVDSVQHEESARFNWEARQIFKTTPQWHRFSHNNLDLVRPIILGQKQIGYLAVRSDLRSFYNSLWWYACSMLAGLVAISFAVYFITRRLQRFISEPISSLVQTIHTVSQTDNYSVRAEKRNNDELGVLIDGFNSMLAQIQDRDDRLEALVKELSASNALAESANTAKSQFLANMSHEIRTPINGVIGMLELLLYNEMTPKLQHYASQAHKSAFRLLVLINDILDISKIESGKLELESENFNLVTTIEDTLEPFTKAVLAKNVAMVCLMDANLPRYVRGDVVRFGQILINLISNAIKFSENGLIVVDIRLIEATKETIRISCSVSDTGIGISPNKKKTIFEPFRQADDSTTRKFGGTGLGLSITRQLVELMSGTIDVESREGEGSCFTFNIMFAAVSVDVNAQTHPRTMLSGKKAVIISSDQRYSEALCRQLADWGMHVRDVVTIPQGMKLLYEEFEKGTPVDIILLDVSVELQPDFASLHQIRFDAAIKDTPLLFLSYLHEDDLITKVPDMNMIGFVSKPVIASSLLRSIAKVMEWESPDPEVGNVSGNDTANIEVSFKARILLVEDNEVNQEVAATYLESLGCQVIIAGNGEIALEAITQQRYDLIFMDCHMPVMDGYTATRLIRTNEKEGSFPWQDQAPARQGPIPIIALTALAMVSDREKCLAHGMDDYLSKPFNLDQLQKILQKWLKNGQEDMSGGGSPVVSCQQLPEAMVQPQADRSEQTIVMPEERRKVIDTSSLDSILALQRAGAPNVLDKLITLYFSNSSVLVHSMLNAIATGDAAGLSSAAHSFKSSSANLGALDLSALCQQMEDLGRECALSRAELLITDIETEYAAVCESLSAIQREISQ